MSQNDFLKFFDPNLAKSLSGFNGFPFDVQTFVESQQKNFQAFTEAQQTALQGIQAAAQRQNELLSQIVEDQSKLAREIMSEGTPEQKVAKQTDLIKKNYESSISNMKEISELLNKSNQQATDIINKRVTASLTEIKTALEKSKAKNSKAANKNETKKVA